MPIALLLQSALAPLADAARVFETWNAVLKLEALVIDRARGAFLVGWFGPNLPRVDGRLQIMIANIDELAEQYRTARAQSMGGQTGPNLAEPLAGMAGMAVGMFISPSGAFMYLYASLRTSLHWIWAALLTLTHGPLMTEIFTGFGSAVAIILLPLAFLGAIGLAIATAAGYRDAQAIYELLGDVARILQAFTRFVNLLMGPREAIRNPLLRQLLGLLDSVAALLAQLIGAAAIIVTRIAPLILLNAREAKALISLGETTMQIAKQLLSSAFDTLLHLVQSEDGQQASPWAVVQRMLSYVMTMVDRLVEGARLALTSLATSLAQGMEYIGSATRSSISAVAGTARSLILDFPLMRSFRAAAAMVTAVRSIFGSSAAPATPATPPPAASGGGLLSALVPPPPTPPTLIPPAAILGIMGPAPPTPSLQGAQDIIETLRRGGKLSLPSGLWGTPLTGAMVAPFELSPDTQRLADQLARPPRSVFAGEREALLQELQGRTPQQALEALRAQELRYRDLLYGVVGEVLPPQIRARIPELLEAFNAIDRAIYGRPESEAPSGTPEFPVRDLPDNGRLRPIVHKITVRSPGGDDISVADFTRDLVAQMREQTYLAVE